RRCDNHGASITEKGRRMEDRSRLMDRPKWERALRQAVAGAAAPSPGSSFGGAGLGTSGNGVAACAPDGGATCGVGAGGVNLPVRTISATWAPSRVSYSSRQLAISSSLSRLL